MDIIYKWNQAAVAIRSGSVHDIVRMTTLRSFNWAVLVHTGFYMVMMDFEVYDLFLLCIQKLFRLAFKSTKKKILNPRWNVFSTDATELTMAKAEI